MIINQEGKEVSGLDNFICSNSTHRTPVRVLDNTVVMNPANITRSNNKRNRSVLEGNNENLRTMIETIRVEVTNQIKVLEDARDAPAEIQLSLQKQLIDLREQLDSLQRQLSDAYEMEIIGKIINGLMVIVCSPTFIIIFYQF
jgi:hypothetical protein